MYGKLTEDPRTGQVREFTQAEKQARANRLANARCGRSQTCTCAPGVCEDQGPMNDHTTYVPGKAVQFAGSTQGYIGTISPLEKTFGDIRAELERLAPYKRDIRALLVLRAALDVLLIQAADGAR